MEFTKFIKTFAPDEKCISLDKKIIKKFKKVAPETLVNLWSNNGIGKYGNGILEIINPEVYRPTLELWLGKKVPNYVPIAISSFGNLYYYRKLTEEDEDVCVIDPNYRSINTCVWSLESFFNEYLINNKTILNGLRNKLFKNAIKKLGKLEIDEIFYFEPALCIGGSENIENINKGNAIIHLDILFQMGQ
jgi:hypothetical protein